jgi:hypothetical protein
MIFGNVPLFIGFIVGGSAKNNKAIMAACALIGFVNDCSLRISAVLTVPEGTGNAQLATFAFPELLPNKRRHSAITLAGDSFFSIQEYS